LSHNDFSFGRYLLRNRLFDQRSGFAGRTVQPFLLGIQKPLSLEQRFLPRSLLSLEFSPDLFGNLMRQNIIDRNRRAALRTFDLLLGKSHNFRYSYNSGNLKLRSPVYFFIGTIGYTRPASKDHSRA
jgi:hypothetical protein